MSIKTTRIRFDQIAVLDDTGTVRRDQYVWTQGGRIGGVSAAKPEGDFDRIYDGNGKLLMPAFYNAHAHSPMTLMRGYGENLVLQEWLERRIFPFEARLDGEQVYWATLLAMAESFSNGIVSTTDMYFFADDIAKAAASCGAKLNIGRAMVAFDENEEMRDMRFYKEAHALFGAWHGAEDGRILVDMALHAEYTSTERLVRQLAEYTQDIGARMQVHVSETEREHEECKMRRGGRTPVRYFADLGLLDSPTTAAHCVWIDDGDIAILSEKGATVASCPVSNLKLASGICNVPGLQAAGINVAIGTDGAASNNSLDILSDMKYFALVNKADKQDPTLITPYESLYAATRAGAKSQGREDCGRIAAGCRADLLVFDIAGPHMQPCHDLLNNIVYAASVRDICLTLSDSVVVYEDGAWPTIDIERAKAEVVAAAATISGALNG
jgi:5-methylthioadenosine/S-adenosylhomocysteine deaminase